MLNLFNNKPYLFHLHTDLTDGTLRPDNYFSFGRRANLTLGFLEHVRQNPTYDPILFIKNIRELSKKYSVPVKVGFEVNISDTGLNIPREALKSADMVGLAIHRYSGTPVDVLNAYIANIKRIKAIKNDIPIIWVHPGLWFRKNGLLKENTVYFLSLLKYVIKKGLLVEFNKRHDLPPLILSGMVPQKQRIIGYDIHTNKDLNQVKIRR